MTVDPRGLATLALLKTRFDEGQDHLGLLEPIVADSLRHVSADSFVPAELAKVIRARSGVEVPADTVKTVLGRFWRRGTVRAAGGRFFPLDVPDSHFQEAREYLEAEHAKLASRLSAFAQEEGIEIAEVDALAALTQFIADNKIPLLLKEPLPDSPLDRTALDRKTARMVARFITTECLPSPELKASLEGLTEGVVLQDALLLRDIAQLGQRFRGLTVAMDTPILLAALDLYGTAEGLATRDFLASLRDVGAITVAFDRTIHEMRRILAVYEDRLATAQGRLSLYPTPLTQYFLTQRASPSDVKTISATLERRLGSLAIPIRELPPRETDYTLDEEALANALRDPSDPDERTDTPRIRHDINCTAGVLTLRRGATASSIERAAAIFCTTSGRTIGSIQNWYAEQGGMGIPPIIHQYALSSIVWLKRPRAAAGVKLYELAALCGAALRPSSRTWTRFIENIEKLRKDGTLSDDEAVAIVASELTQPLLARLDDESEPDADTIQEAIDRILQTYRVQAEKASKDAIRTAQGEATLARSEAAEASEQLAAVVSVARGRAGRLGRTVSMLVYWGLVAIVVAAALLSLPGVAPTPALQFASWVIIGLGLVVGVTSQIIGYSLADLRERVASWVENKSMERRLGLKPSEAARLIGGPVAQELADGVQRAPDGAEALQSDGELS